jgi:hypothetical protein
MKHLLPLLALALACCATPKSSQTQGVVRYRYVNTLNVGNDLIMDQVQVTGYDDTNLGEANRLVVQVNQATITLRSVTGDGGAMYTPAVELAKGGSLRVSWGEIDDGQCDVLLELQGAGVLTILSREVKSSSGRQSHRSV